MQPPVGDVVRRGAPSWRGGGITAGATRPPCRRVRWCTLAVYILAQPSAPRSSGATGLLDLPRGPLLVCARCPIFGDAMHRGLRVNWKIHHMLDAHHQNAVIMTLCSSLVGWRSNRCMALCPSVCAALVHCGAFVA